MLTQAIWPVGIILEAVILYRGLRGKLRSEYPGFYLYVLSVLLVEAVRFVFFYGAHERTYGQVYWGTQFASVVIGCAVIFAIYRAGLKAFPGTARMARNVLSFVFAMVFAKAIVTSTDGTSWLARLTALQLERDLRIVQGCALIALGIVFLAYAIPMSRNLKAIVVGYGVFVGASIIQLSAMVGMGENFHGAWGYLRSGAYLLVLAGWAVGLWSYQEAPKPAREITLDTDYQTLVLKTKRKFQKSRIAMEKAARP
jgi:hypothetical protein